MPVRVRQKPQREGIVTELSGWLDFVVRSIADMDPKLRNLASVVLVAAALGAAEPSVAGMVLGEKHETLTGRAQRELSARIESLYQREADLAVSQLDAILGDPGPGRMLESRARFVESLHFADA